MFKKYIYINYIYHSNHTTRYLWSRRASAWPTLLPTSVRVVTHRPRIDRFGGPFRKRALSRRLLTWRDETRAILGAEVVDKGRIAPRSVTRLKSSNAERVSRRKHHRIIAFMKAKCTKTKPELIFVCEFGLGLWLTLGLC